jgi:hypothetical protein
MWVREREERERERERENLSLVLVLECTTPSFFFPQELHLTWSPFCLHWALLLRKSSDLRACPPKPYMRLQPSYTITLAYVCHHLVKAI